MKHRSKSSKSRLRNDLDWLDPNQPLTKDEFYSEKIPEPEMTLRESLSYGLRSTLAVIICLVIPALWYFDWDPSAFADKTSEIVSGVLVGAPSAPLLPALEAPLVPSTENFGEGVTDYIALLKEAGLIEEFSFPAIRAFYENNVPIDFLTNLHNANLLEHLSFPAVISFYQNNVPIEYLTQLENASLLDELSFPAVVALHQNDVPLIFLNQLREVNLLDEFSFPAIVAFHQNGVTFQFLQGLDEKDLLESLSFPDIVNMFQANN